MMKISKLCNTLEKLEKKHEALLKKAAEIYILMTECKKEINEELKNLP